MQPWQGLRPVSARVQAGVGVRLEEKPQMRKDPMYTHNKTKTKKPFYWKLNSNFKLILQSWEKCQIIPFTVATYNTNSPFEVQSKLVHNRDLWHKAEFVQYVHGKQILGNSDWEKKNKNEKLVFTQNATHIFVPQKSKNGKAYPKKKMEFYSEYLRNYCKLWFWLI